MTKEERQLLDEKYGGQKTPGFEEDGKRLQAGEPLAYIIGWQPFLGLKIYLDNRPLIPRPETEWWVEKLMGEAGAIFSATGCSKAEPEPEGAKKSLRRPALLDLCAGSGTIGCVALKMLSNTIVYFGEIDPAHKSTIEKNIRENGLDESRADIRIGDLFEPFKGLIFDIIAVNPPYIPSHRALPESISRYEPAKALYAGEDGLDLIRRIAKDLPNYLAKGGQAWIECDSEHAEAAGDLFKSTGMQAKIHTDLYGRPRLLVISFP